MSKKTKLTKQQQKDRDTVNQVMRELKKVLDGKEVMAGVFVALPGTTQGIVHTPEGSKIFKQVRGPQGPQIVVSITAEAIPDPEEREQHISDLANMCHGIHQACEGIQNFCADTVQQAQEQVKLISIQTDPANDDGGN